MNYDTPSKSHAITFTDDETLEAFEIRGPRWVTAAQLREMADSMDEPGSAESEAAGDGQPLFLTMADGSMWSEVGIQQLLDRERNLLQRANALQLELDLLRGQIHLLDLAQVPGSTMYPLLPLRVEYPEDGKSDSEPVQYPNQFSQGHNHGPLGWCSTECPAYRAGAGSDG